MYPNVVLDKIINHEMFVEEAQHVKNLFKGIISSRKQDIAFKASKKSKSKKVVEESSREEDDDDSDDESTEYDLVQMTLIIRRFSKMMGKQKFFKGDKKTSFNERPRELAIIVVSMVTILLITLISIGKKRMKRRRRRRRRRRKRRGATRKISITKRNPMVRRTSGRSGTPMMRVPIPIATVWPP
jgi:hypothetical protein